MQILKKPKLRIDIICDLAVNEEVYFEATDERSIRAMISGKIKQRQP